MKLNNFDEFLEAVHSTLPHLVGTTEWTLDNLTNTVKVTVEHPKGTYNDSFSLSGTPDQFFYVFESVKYQYNKDYWKNGTPIFYYRKAMPKLIGDPLEPYELVNSKALYVLKDKSVVVCIWLPIHLTEDMHECIIRDGFAKPVIRLTIGDFQKEF
jgi:hypothetical protein